MWISYSPRDAAAGRMLVTDQLATLVLAPRPLVRALDDGRTTGCYMRAVAMFREPVRTSALAVGGRSG
jgi:hypothetical protein